VRIRVIRVEHRHGGCLAHFRSDHGDAVGRWSSPTPPVTGSPYRVDVEVAEFLTVGQSLLTLPTGPARVTTTSSNTILIQGVVERAWPEGVLSIRVGDALIDVETDRLVAPGKWVLAECREIRLYNVNGPSPAQ
jgi:hypothetical protein